MKKIIITVVGIDAVGIIAKICCYLAKKNINILDISQTIVHGYFNMMMVVDIAKSTESMDKIFDDLERKSTEIGVKIQCQSEEIFQMMHRI